MLVRPPRLQLEKTLAQGALPAAAAADGAAAVAAAAAAAGGGGATKLELTLKQSPGVKLGFRLSDDNVVLSVLPGGPAEAAGFVTGDLVLALDGSALDGRPAVPIFQQPPAPLPTDRKVVVTRKAAAAATAPPAAADAVPAKKTSDGRNVLLF